WSSDVCSSDLSPPVIELTETEDILKYAGHHSDGMYVIGFAAETEDVENYALGKLQAKKADVIIMNDVSDTSIGMNSDDNEVTMLFKDGEKIPLDRKSTRLNSSHVSISYAVFCLKKKKIE